MFKIMILAAGFAIFSVAQGAERVVCMNSDLSDPETGECSEVRAKLVEKSLEMTISMAKDETGLDSMLAPAVVSYKGSGSVKIMAQNFGTAAFKWTRAGKILPSIKANCEKFKLCDPKIIAEITANILKVEPDVMLISEAQGVEQLLGTHAGGPVLPSHYDAVCVYGHQGIKETCIAWNTRRAKLKAENCRAVIGLQSGAVSCPLEVDGQVIQFVSSHPSAWMKNERNALVKAIWAKLVDRSQPAVVGGDWNTQNGTLGFSKAYPYPGEFGTLFGRFVKRYGRWSAAKSFFGHFHWDERTGELTKPHSHRTTTLTTKIDQIFANFGQPAMLTSEDNACINTSCVGGKDEGFDWDLDGWSFGKTFGSKLDHRPILTRLSW